MAMARPQALGSQYLVLFVSWDGDHGVTIVDRSDPANLVVVATLPQYGLTSGVLDEGQVLWCAGDFGNLTAIDVHDPAHPTVISEMAMPPNAHDAVLSGPHELAIANGTSGITLIDISDPANPTVKGIQLLEGSPAGVLFDGAHLFVASQHRLQSIAR
jgi:hypothetical protein